jgi:NAD-dependent SIR2 family protein deacetylase
MWKINACYKRVLPWCWCSPSRSGASRSVDIVTNNVDALARAAQHVKRGAFHAVCSSEVFAKVNCMTRDGITSALPAHGELTKVSAEKSKREKVKQGRVRFCASEDPKASRREHCRVEQTQQ